MLRHRLYYIIIHLMEKHLMSIMPPGRLIGGEFVIVTYQTVRFSYQSHPPPPINKITSPTPLIPEIPLSRIYESQYQLREKVGKTERVGKGKIEVTQSEKKTKRRPMRYTQRPTNNKNKSQEFFRQKVNNHIQLQDSSVPNFCNSLCLADNQFKKAVVSPINQEQLKEEEPVNKSQRKKIFSTLPPKTLKVQQIELPPSQIRGEPTFDLFDIFKKIAQQKAKEMVPMRDIPKNETAVKEEYVRQVEQVISKYESKQSLRESVCKEIHLINPQKQGSTSNRETIQ